MEITGSLDRSNMQRAIFSEKLAINLLEQAESLSKEGKIQDSIKAFRQAAKLFADVEAFSSLKDQGLQDSSEEDLVERTKERAWLKKTYCLARIEMEEAKWRKLKGDYESSIEKYALATEKFEEIIEALREESFLKVSKLKGRDKDPNLLGTVYSKEDSLNKVSTGYKPLDDLLFGGVPKNYAVILTSPPCDEKDLLLRMFLGRDLDRWTTFYVSTNINKVVDILERNPPEFYTFVYNSQSGLVASKFPNVYGIENLDDLSSINISLVSALTNLDGKGNLENRRICIDVLSDVLLRLKALTSRRWLSDLIPRLKAKGFTVIATLNPYMHSKEEASAIIDLFDGHIDIYEKEEKGRISVFLRIRRMYGHRYLRKELMLDRDQMFFKESRCNKS